MLRWTTRDLFTMGDLKSSLAQIEKRALEGRPVILTRHGRPTFALLRIDKLEELAVGSDPHLTQEDRGVYDKAFADADEDAVAHQLSSWDEVLQRVDRVIARKRVAPKRRKTHRAAAAR